ncbi:MAG: starch synthase [Clostridiales bacterium GWF2_38_85]|nr:MAG: starch synthase [Clostridiales bacterium GWF2_38_85]
MANVKKILFVASEALPFASTGGLGDVIGSLPLALKRLQKESLDIRVIIPLYKTLEPKYREQMIKICETTIALSWRNQYAAVYMIEREGVKFYFIDNEHYFNRRFLYGSFDDGERFAFFCKAVVELLPKIDFIPDILHAHDWQSALTVIYLKGQYANRGEYRNIKTVFTIHNIEYQGVYGFDILGDIFDLTENDRQTVDYNGAINLMKGAIVSCDMLTTVSPTYANEILRQSFSAGLHNVLDLFKGKIRGIINGIDMDYYNPKTDSELFNNYDPKLVSMKKQNKIQLQKMLGLPEDPDIPMIAMITRLASHKGVDLISHAADELLSNNIQFVLLGTGDFHYEAFFTQLKEHYPSKVSILLMFNRDMSKKIYAASDIFLMPSQSEPCGLSQMIASRYGTVPVVRSVGGLHDTIHEGINGFSFNEYESSDMMAAVYRALEKFKNKVVWNEFVKDVMNTDFSWDKSAKEYLSLYDEVT